MIPQIQNLNKLLPEERQTLAALYTSWVEARRTREYASADKLRHHLYLWDSTLSTSGIWYPIFEHSLHRQKRAHLRMIRYKVDVYPWNQTEV